MRKAVVSQNKSKSRSTVNRTASVGLIQYLNHKYEKSIPISAFTAAHKLFGKSKPLSKDDKFVKRFADNQGNIDTKMLVNYLGKAEPLEKGKGLSDEAVKRVYQNFSNHDGKLTFQYIMKMGESCGVSINQRMAKAIVLKYGKRKDHLSIEECLKLNNKKRQQSKSQSKKVK